MAKKLELYRVTISQPISLDWAKHPGYYLDSMIRIGAEVLKLDGLVTIDKSYNPSYSYDSFNVKIPSDKVRDLERTKGVRSVRRA